MYDFVGSFWPILLAVLLIVLAFMLRGKNTFYHWAARMIALLDILFLAWESMVLGGNAWGRSLVDNILIIILLLVVLIAAWKNDLVGAIGFFLAGIFMLGYFVWGDFPIGFVPLLIGVIFYMSRRKKRKTAI